MVVVVKALESVSETLGSVFRFPTPGEKNYTY